ELDQLSQAYQTDKQAAEEERKNLEALELQVSQETRDFEEKRKTILGGLEPALKGRYERVRTSRQTAVTTVLQGTCQACNMRIAPQLLIEVQKFTTIHSCPSCHRILYVIGGSS
ncbi:MAG: hypothetical protein HYY44_01135, partial [Deltaproteobacteria bacterium]|nr:hypothetical protein [Deltaproteobacteria bacterium]